jgi:hypothetical protein
MMKKKYSFLKTLLIIFLGWWLSTTIRQMILCPKMTQTQIILNTPNSIVLDYNRCDLER